MTTMLLGTRHRAALTLLAVACAWTAGGIATAVHFHGVAHVEDAHNGDVIHAHSCDCHAGPSQVGRSRVTHPDEHPRSADSCLHMGLAMHGAALAAVGSTGSSSVLRAALSSPSRDLEGHPTLAVLAAAPKLPPPATA